MIASVLAGRVDRSPCRITGILSAYFIAILSVCALCRAHAEESVRFLVPQDVIDDYTALLGDRSPLDVDSYSGTQARRDVIEMILLQQALARGGWHGKIQWVAARLYDGILDDVANGYSVGTGTTVWLNDLDERKADYLVSEPLIREGEFVAGLYTVMGNKKARTAKSEEALRALTVVSNRNWSRDWLALESYGFENIRDVSSWPTIVHALEANIADVTLAPFNHNKRMAIQYENIRLVPIRGWKVALPGERVFAFSAKNDQARILFPALLKGLGMMRDEGTIRRAYTECGFFNETAIKWKELQTVVE